VLDCCRGMGLTRWSSFWRSSFGVWSGGWLRGKNEERGRHRDSSTI
jgi:hypothetical protein